MARRARRVAAEALLAVGDWAAAADAATALVERDPFDEAALRVLLRARATGGQVASALAAYASARERLADELGTDPAPETTALHMAILRGELTAPDPRPAPAGGREPTRPHLVGRDDELRFLDSIAQRARGGATALVVVDGEAGIGKTALLRAWCARRSSAGDLVVLASCGQLDRAMPLDALLGALAGVLGRFGPEQAADLLGADATLLAPLLGGGSGQPEAPALADSMLGPAVLYAALARMLRALAGRGPLVVVIDDAHLAGPALPDLLRFVLRDGPPAAVVAAVRAGEGEPLPRTAAIHLEALGKEAVSELVGAGRAGELMHGRKGTRYSSPSWRSRPRALSCPLRWSSRCRRGVTSSAAPGRCCGRPLSSVPNSTSTCSPRSLAAAPSTCSMPPSAVATQFLAEDGGGFRFRHELVQEALASSTTAGRAVLLHRQAGRVLARRPGADPAAVARHARLGGDLVLASSALRDAAARAAERFDHAAAEALLDEALTLHPGPQAWLARARVRTQRGRYAGALRDVGEATAGGVGPAAHEVGAWACYFDRRFAEAAQFADDGAMAAPDVATRARCLAVGGRIRHAAGDLRTAETLLAEALTLAGGADQVMTAAWLGVLRAHQSRTDEAVALLRPASRGQLGAEHTSATLHALLFLGHAYALAGRPAQALEEFARYTAEVERRQVPRFAGRAVNFSGWVLRNLGAHQEALAQHRAALSIGRGHGTAEVTIAALEDLAEQCVDDGDADGAQSYLGQAADLLAGDVVFGWRLGLKLRLISGRLALLRGDPAATAAEAAELERRAAALGVPRYVAVARLLSHRARSRQGLPVALDQAEADLDLLDASIRLEAWWWTGDLAADCGKAAWLDRAAGRAAELAAAAGPQAGTLQAAAERRMTQWRSAFGG